MAQTVETTSPKPTVPAQSDSGRTTYVVLVTFIAALGGLLFGFDTAVIAGTTPFITGYFALDETALGWAVSSVLVGCMAGTLFAGKLSDRFGRKPILILTAVLFTFSAIWTALATGFSSFIFARILGGLGVGTASMLAPIYIAEIAPPEQRGRLVSLNQLTIVLGILVAFFSNYLLVNVGVNNWRWMFGVEAIPALLFFLFLFLVPESPRWLARHGDIAESARVLAKIRGRGAAEAELASIMEVLRGEHQGRFGDLFAPRLRILLGIGIMLALLQQVTGINVIMYYAPLLFASTGVAAESALLQTVVIGLVNLGFTFVAIRLIDRMGRKPLLLLGSAAMTLSLSVLAAAFFLSRTGGFLVLFSILIYIASFAASLGPVVWVVNSEIFPTKIRGQAMSVATFVLWTANFLVTLTFPWLLEHLKGGFTFLMYASLCAVTFVFVWHFVPETKGKSLEQIERELVGIDY